MTLKDFLGNSTFAKVTYVMWLISSAFILVLIGRVDGIVHGDLYNYGLQFNINWAVNYWSAMRLIYVCMAIPMVFSIAALVASFWNKGNGVRPVREIKRVNGKDQTAKDSSMIISCPKCKKVFSKPLTMLDFSSGRANLVNVCPYCSHILGNANENPESVHIRPPEDQIIQEREQDS